jgi:endonuclease-3
VAAASTTERRASRASAVARRLAEVYPEAVCELDYGNPWQLLVATVLSAQSTDERVNTVTPGLFERWPDPRALAGAPADELEDAIRPTGLHRSKARNLRESARIVAAEYKGDVPADRAALVALPGVGRKTASVVLGEAFGIPAGIAVDTHVRRLAGRIGLSSSDTPDRIADDLEAALPADEWIDFSKRLILHGRRVCAARNPRCEGCALFDLCERIGV